LSHVSALFRGSRNYEKSGLHAIVRYTIPHDARFTAGNGMLEGDHLTGVQCGVSMNGAKSVFAIVHQAAHDFLWRRIIEREGERAFPLVAVLGAAIVG
jgi:hypothetical protein